MARIPLRLAAVLLVALIAVIAYMATGFSFGKRERSVVGLDPAQIIVVRTPGGMLEVATLIKNEEFGWSVSYTCPMMDCSKILKPTISRVRVPVHYTYRIPLAATWELRFNGSEYELTVPPPEPMVPVPFDTAKMEIETTRGGWLSPPASGNTEALIRHLGRETERRANQDHYVAMQREQASRTVAEFARKWMGEQMKPTQHPVKVIFKQSP